MRVRPAPCATLALVLAAAPLACSGPAFEDVSPAETKLVEQTLLDGHLKLLVPEHFVALDETAIHARFHLDLASVVAFQNGDGSIELVAFHQKSAVGPSKTDAEMPIEQKVKLLGAVIRRAYAAKRTIRDEIVTRDGRPINFFEVGGALHEKDRRVLCAYTLLFDQPFEVLFSCPESRAAEWAPIGQRIIDSVVVTE